MGPPIPIPRAERIAAAAYAAAAVGRARLDSHPYRRSATPPISARAPHLGHVPSNAGQPRQPSPRLRDLNSQERHEARRRRAANAEEQARPATQQSQSAQPPTARRRVRRGTRRTNINPTATADVASGTSSTVRGAVPAHAPSHPYRRSPTPLTAPVAEGHTVSNAGVSRHGAQRRSRHANREESSLGLEQQSAIHAVPANGPQELLALANLLTGIAAVQGRPVQSVDGYGYISPVAAGGAPSSTTADAPASHLAAATAVPAAPRTIVHAQPRTLPQTAYPLSRPPSERHSSPATSSSSSAESSSGFDSGRETSPVTSEPPSPPMRYLRPSVDPPSPRVHPTAPAAATAAPPAHAPRRAPAHTFNDHIALSQQSASLVRALMQSLLQDAGGAPMSTLEPAEDEEADREGSDDLMTDLTSDEEAERDDSVDESFAVEDTNDLDDSVLVEREPEEWELIWPDTDAARRAYDPTSREILICEIRAEANNPENYADWRVPDPVKDAQEPARVRWRWMYLNMPYPVGWEFPRWFYEGSSSPEAWEASQRRDAERRAAWQAEVEARARTTS